MSNSLKLFMAMLIVQLFYAFAITSITYALEPTGALVDKHIQSFSDIISGVNAETVAAQVQGNIQKQTNIPIIELGALVFYSGNYLIDLLLNFAFAIPQMVGQLIAGITYMFNFDPFLANQLELFASGVVGLFYFMGIIQLLLNVRSGQLV